MQTSTEKPKSYAREVGGSMLLLIVVLLLYTFFAMTPEKIEAVEGIFMGFCAPVAITCLGLFGVRSFQDHKK